MNTDLPICELLGWEQFLGVGDVLEADAVDESHRGRPTDQEHDRRPRRRTRSMVTAATAGLAFCAATLAAVSITIVVSVKGDHPLQGRRQWSSRLWGRRLPLAVRRFLAHRDWSSHDRGGAEDTFQPGDA